MAKNFSHNGLVVSFKSRAFDCNDYSVYERATAETRVIHKFDDGRFERTGADASARDVAAVQAFIEADKAEFRAWLAANPDLQAAYAKLSVGGV